ncbi:GLPGLI family protein (plasmid) [Flavobacterium sp. CBA20B-1]|uniref:GLPGLI family protein n=1 Tax=unclassified Flavobacterium TaxID=196869 RepID=UPI00222461B9|nr:MULTISPECIES: GLPGLI family protein [unclassified Flavobacterium]WCM43600.1 GLPGLI family protein [Flavobacterium sp. CBA20B-1]
MKIICFILFYFSLFAVTAQERIKVDYSEYKHVQIPILQKGQLYIDLKNEKTVWVENTSSRIENYDKKNIEKPKNEDIRRPDNSFEVSLGRTIPDDYVLYDYKNRKIEIIEDLGKKVFSVPDTFNELKWNLQKETKTVNNIECFKATTNFRGNDWDVWYAPSIPYPYGPWKLHGLPGLILEAKTKDGFYTLIADKIEYNYPENNQLVPRDKILKELSFKEYLEYQDVLFNMLFLGEDMPKQARDIFAHKKERKFETKANLSWMK